MYKRQVLSGTFSAYRFASRQLLRREISITATRQTASTTGKITAIESPFAILELSPESMPTAVGPPVQPRYPIRAYAAKMIKKLGARTTAIIAGVFGGVAYTVTFIIGYHPFGQTFQDKDVYKRQIWF